MLGPVVVMCKSVFAPVPWCLYGLGSVVQPEIKGSGDAALAVYLVFFRVNMP